jgi:hypothetical protein
MWNFHERKAHPTFVHEQTFSQWNKTRMKAAQHPPPYKWGTWSQSPFPSSTKPAITTNTPQIRPTPTPNENPWTCTSKDRGNRANSTTATKSPLFWTHETIEKIWFRIRALPQTISSQSWFALWCPRISVCPWPKSLLTALWYKPRLVPYCIGYVRSTEPFK